MTTKAPDMADTSNRPLDDFLGAAVADDPIAAKKTAEEMATQGLQLLDQIATMRPALEEDWLPALDSLISEVTTSHPRVEAIAHAWRLKRNNFDDAIVRITHEYKRGSPTRCERLVKAARRRAEEIDKDLKARARREARAARERERKARREEARQAARRGPLIVKPPGFPVFYVRLDTEDGSDYRECDERLLRGILERHHPNVPTWNEPKGDGEPTPIPASQIVERFSVPCDKVSWDWTSSITRWEPDHLEGGQLFVGLDRVPPIEPEFSDDVAEWFEQIGGEHHQLLLDWVATYQDLTQVTSALVLGGPGGAGKGLLAAALARRWGGQFCTYKDVLATAFNARLKENPVVFLDEAAPTGRFRVGSNAFKSFVGERQHQLSEKRKTTGELYGALRLVIATNDDDPLGLASEDMSEHSVEATSDRITFIRVPDSARNVLTNERVRRWLVAEGGGPGALVRHIEWLHQNLDVEVGNRFLVSGNGEAWIRQLRAMGSTAQLILFAVIRAAREVGRPGEEPVVWFRGGDVFASPEGLLSRWRTLTGREGWNVPDVSTLGRTLSGISPDKRPSRPRWSARRDGTRPRLWRIPGQTVLEFADRVGVDDDAIRRKVLGPRADTEDGGPGGPDVVHGYSDHESDRSTYG